MLHSHRKTIFSFFILSTTFINIAVASSESINWFVSGNDIICSPVGFSNSKIDASGWQGIVTDPVYPKIDIESLNIDADGYKYLYLKMSSTDRQSLRILYSQDTQGRFSELCSFTTSPLDKTGDWIIYRMNLTDAVDWHGVIRRLRIYFSGHTETDTVRIFALGVSAQPVDSFESHNVTELKINTSIKAHDRMAAWQDTIVTVNTVLPNSCLMTYAKNKPGNFLHHYILAKLVPGVQTKDGVIFSDQARQTWTEDIPGGAVSEFMLGDVKVTTKITTMLTDRDISNWHGAAIYEIKTEPATAIVLRCGGGLVDWNHGEFSWPWVLTPDVDFNGSKVEIEQDVALLSSPVHPLSVGVCGDGVVAKQVTEKSNEYLNINFDNGSGKIVLSFAKDPLEAQRLAKLYVSKGGSEVNDYYDNLLQNCRINTPKLSMNQAFESAVLLMDYSWYAPVGWMESFHHWLGTFHMQHSGGVQLIGQTDRARDCLLSHARNLQMNGIIPNFTPSGNPRPSAFGSSNQYYFWQVLQYLKYTNDVDTLREIAPALDKVLEFTFDWYDSDKDLMLAWGLQVGNQEDFVATPHNGTVPTIEGINMMRTRMLVAQALGDTDTVCRLLPLINQAKETLRDTMWMNDLGRFIFYQDPYGQKRLEGHYQACIYPLIWDIVDPLDAYTGMRHLRDRLTGKDGEIFNSNNFPDHLLDVWATWGMQAGAAQQPWGAWGLAAMGMHNETYRPLNAVSQWVMNDIQRGSWPEVANEKRLGYFSPPAGLYIQAVVEALFGLQLDKPQKTLTVSPSFPDHWPQASITLPDFSAQYSRDGNTLTYRVKSREKLSRKIRWMLPLCKIEKLKINDKKTKYNITPGVNCIILETTTEPAVDTTITLEINPLKYEIDYPASVAQGDSFTIKTDNVSIVSVQDRCNVLASVQQKDDNELKVTVQNNLLADYSKFSRLGQMNFSRRTFFLYCSVDENYSFYLPVDLLILPRYEATITDQLLLDENGGKLNILIRNNTDSILSGKATLRALQTQLPFDISVSLRSEKLFTVPFNKECLRYLSPGDNQAKLLLPSGDILDVTLIASDPKNIDPDLARKKMVQIKLPDDALIGQEKWEDTRPHFQHMVARKDGMDVFPEGQAQIDIPQLPGVSFMVDNRKFVPVSPLMSKPSFTLQLDSKPYKKLYLLVASMIANHDMFTDIARIDVQLDDKQKHGQVGMAVVTRTLSSPGDLDWWQPIGSQVRISTYLEPRLDRYGLLPLLSVNDADWDIAKPPVFPQTKYWTDTLTLAMPSMNLNVIEIDLDQQRHVKSLTISMLGTDPALGLLAVTAEKGE